MSRKTRDKDYRPKKRVIVRRAPGRARPQTESIRYREYDSKGSSLLGQMYSQEVDSDTDHFSDCTETKSVDAWIPVTITRNIEGPLTDFFEHCRQHDMAKQAEKAGMEKIMELFMQMRKMVMQGKREGNKKD